MEKQQGLGAFSTGVICSTNFDILNEHPAAFLALPLAGKAAKSTPNIILIFGLGLVCLCPVFDLRLWYK